MKMIVWEHIRAIEWKLGNRKLRVGYFTWLNASEPFLQIGRRRSWSIAIQIRIGRVCVALSDPNVITE